MAVKYHYFVLLLVLDTVYGHYNTPSGKPIINFQKRTDDTNNINVWPYPQSLVSGVKYFSINPTNFKFITKTKGECDLLDKAIGRYQSLPFIQDCSLVSDRGFMPFFDNRADFNDINYSGQLLNITIQVNTKCETTPHLDMSEMYTIDINDEISLIFADSVWGAIRGLETFSQLITSVGPNQFTINTTSILDFPRFSHRGLLLDTSRHYVPVKVLLQNLDAMVYNKLNVFHWHIVDDQSFPYVSQRFPDLSTKGAYNPNTHIYKPQDIETVIEYARERGIRVLVEFDTPGHTLSWGKGQPGLLTPCYSGPNPNGNFGPIDPSKNSSYDFIKQLFTEVTKTFPDQYLHLGGDEVDFGCWKSNPDIIEFMKQKHIEGDFAKLEDYYVQNVLDIVKGLNKSYIVWQEVYDNKVAIKSDTIVHIWKDNWQQEIFNVTQNGFHILLSSCWYLDYISYGPDWRQYYTCDPQSFNGTEQQNKLVIGGEACMWGEFVDATNLISKTWPRAIAVAERLWSSSDLIDPNAANGRFDAQHCKMQQRGLDVEPANGPGFCQCDYAI